MLRNQEWISTRGDIDVVKARRGKEATQTGCGKRVESTRDGLEDVEKDAEDPSSIQETRKRREVGKDTKDNAPQTDKWAKWQHAPEAR